MKKLKTELKEKLIPYAANLLDFISLKSDFSFLPFNNVTELPAIKWKLKNLEKLALSDRDKFDLQYFKLKDYFES